MVFINEWLPNPKGDDAKGEWAELHNSGKDPVGMDGWRITSDGKKFFMLRGTIGPGGYLVVPRTASKITLKNTDGTLALYDPAGHIADKIEFRGTAQEGQSVNRAPTGFFFGKPTPGSTNMLMTSIGMIQGSSYSLSVPLGPVQARGPQFIGSLLGSALVLAAAILFILKSHEDLSHLFFDAN